MADKFNKKSIQDMISKADNIKNPSPKKPPAKIQEPMTPLKQPDNPERFIVWFHTRDFWWRYFRFEYKWWSGSSILTDIVRVILMAIVVFLIVEIYNTGYLLYLLLCGFTLISLYVIISYLVFKGWRKRLTVVLKGWDGLVNDVKFRLKQWRNVAIDVKLTRDDPATIKAVDAALFLFCRIANTRFYDTYNTDTRTKWECLCSLRATGSANPDVIREIKKLIQGPLCLIAREYGTIQTVRVSASGLFIKLEIDRPSSD